MNLPIEPRETQPTRLAPLPKLPIFLDLQGRRVVVAGDGHPIAWKAELIAAAGARVEVFAEEPGPDLRALVARDGNSIVLHERTWAAADLAGAALAIGSGEAPDEATRFAEAARAHGCLVNVVDKPDFCDFQFPTIVNRAPVVVAISTDGAAPILGQAIRRRIEAVLPHRLGVWGEAAKGFRERLKEIVPTWAGRRQFWERFVELTFASKDAEASRSENLERLAHEVADGRDESRPAIGEVVIVGAGPGDPELLTLKGMRELQAADAIVYDRLVTPAVLELGRREARRIYVGKEGHGAACRQEDISALLVDLALSGQRVVRLKGGDPAVFGRTGEEVDACAAAGVPVRIVAGVTSASAAAASMGLSLTRRQTAGRVQFVTGHDRHGHLPADLDLDALADPRSTTVLYMGGRTAAELARLLIARDLPAVTPVVIASNVSRDDERRTSTTLGEIADGLPLDGTPAPTLILIGAALRGGEETAHAPAAVRVLAQVD